MKSLRTTKTIFANPTPNTKSFYRIKEESAPDSWVLSLASKETPGEISEELKKL